MLRGISLDYETADRITVLVLKEQLSFMQESLRAKLEDDKYLHPTDSELYTEKYIPSIKMLLEYFGEQ